MRRKNKFSLKAKPSRTLSVAEIRAARAKAISGTEEGGD
jgi:hypothetical protein